MTSIRTALVSVLAGCAIAATVTSANAAVVGDYGYHGPISVSAHHHVKTWNHNPIVALGHAIGEILYMNVPDHHRRDWRVFCHEYNACSRPVMFVQDSWYRDTYVPAYRRHNPDWNRHHAKPVPPKHHVPVVAPKHHGPALAPKHHAPAPAPKYHAPAPAPKHHAPAHKHPGHL